jgi:hypothetical protein
MFISLPLRYHPTPMTNGAFLTEIRLFFVSLTHTEPFQRMNPLVCIFEFLFKIVTH